MRINCLVESARWAESRIVLSPEQSHHLARVVRVAEGQELTVFDGQGQVAIAVVNQLSKREVFLTLCERWQESKPATEVELIQALPKLDRWEWVLQKAVELGATAIRPVLTQHTESRLSEKKVQRWHQIIQSAAEQCEARWMPKLHPVQPLMEVFPLLKSYECSLIASLYPGAQPLQKVELRGVKSVSLLIGPEGDFTQDEVDGAVDAGAQAVSFGSRILRTETAAIYGLSILNHGVV
ncbi:MAG: RsmE family RNA methyltransferase [Pontiellaceae bacterium]